jgi:hypothetical protein
MNDWRITSKQGKTMTREQREHADRIVKEAMRMEQIRFQSEQASDSQEKERLDGFLVGLERNWLSSRKQKGDREGKIGVVVNHCNPRGQMAGIGSPDIALPLSFALTKSWRCWPLLSASILRAGASRRWSQVGQNADQWAVSQPGEYSRQALYMAERSHCNTFVPARKTGARRAWRNEQQEVQVLLLCGDKRPEALKHLQGLLPVSGDMPSSSSIAEGSLVPGNSAGQDQ